MRFAVTRSCILCDKPARHPLPYELRRLATPDEKAGNQFCDWHDENSSTTERAMRKRCGVLYCTAAGKKAVPDAIPWTMVVGIVSPRVCTFHASPSGIDEVLARAAADEAARVAEQDERNAESAASARRDRIWEGLIGGVFWVVVVPVVAWLFVRWVLNDPP